MITLARRVFFFAKKIPAAEKVYGFSPSKEFCVHVERTSPAGEVLQRQGAQSSEEELVSIGIMGAKFIFNITVVWYGRF